MTTEVFDLDAIDRAVAKAKSVTPVIRPARVIGCSKEFYAMWTHPSRTPGDLEAAGFIRHPVYREFWLRPEDLDRPEELP